ncbi:MAG: hypothetical protein BWY09_00468 [Candidatus Hydrogenedentes bacterium ADurb.Bin179]|nr:MAG: hypothetical protein BWY09_00468 [Candidatus Hydrogenedentes bacterium ADurb.Bin179]
MAITAVVVSATLNTTGDTAFTSSGFGTPDAAIILLGRGGTANNPQVHATFTGGFWCSDPGQAGITFCSEDAQVTTDTRRYGDSTYAGHIASPTTDSVVISYSASATTDGINLSVAAGSTTLNRYASVILLKGLTNAHVGSVSLGTGTSAINVTAPGFRADLVLLLSTWAANATVTAAARGSFGAAQISAGGTVAQGCISYESTDNAAASTARTIVLNDKALARITSGALAVECAIGANDNGFSITPSADSGSQYAYYLAIECPDPEDAYVGVVDTITGEGDQAYTGAGLTPQALILASTLATAVDTVTDSGAFNVGFGGPATSEWSSVYIDEYNSDPTDTEGYVDTSNILHIRSAVGTEDTVASLTAFGSDGWTLNYSNGSGAARKMLAIAIGTAASGAQTLTPSLVTNTQTFHAATVIRGAVTLTPSLVTNSQTFHAATVSTGSVTLEPSLVTNGQTFYAPVVSNGGVTLAPSLVTNSQTFPSPTISVGAVTLTLDVVVNGQTFYAPTVAQPSGQTLEPTLVTNGQMFYGPTVEGMLLTQADLDAIAAAVWADPAAVAAHAKLDAIIARITC